MPELQREEFGRYLLLTRLDAGGMAEIFLARPVNPTAEHPLVVVKRILPDLARDPDMLRMFVDEARLSQHLVHPHIVRTLDLGRVGQRPYLVMELLRGESLGQVLRASVKAGLWPGHALAADLVRQAALGLEHAHNACDGQGRPLAIVHRDVSPQNLFVQYDGLVKVVDFGIAKASLRKTRTKTGHLMGKFAYMAPEQVDGEADWRSDIFALGIILWECLTRRRLFKEEAPLRTLERIRGEDVPPPRAVAPAVPEALSALTARALARDRNARLQSCRELADGLQEYLRSAGPPAGHPPLGALMQRLFAERRQQKEELLRAASRDEGAPRAGWQGILGEDGEDRDWDSLRSGAGSAPPPADRPGSFPTLPSSQQAARPEAIELDAAETDPLDDLWGALTKGDAEAAMGAYRLLLAAGQQPLLEPELALALARVLAQHGLPRDALETCRRAYDQHTADPAAADLLLVSARLLAGPLGQREDARALLEHLLHRHPDAAVAGRAQQDLRALVEPQPAPVHAPAEPASAPARRPAPPDLRPPAVRPPAPPPRPPAPSWPRIALVAGIAVLALVWLLATRMMAALPDPSAVSPGLWPQQDLGTAEPGGVVRLQREWGTAELTPVGSFSMGGMVVALHDSLERQEGLGEVFCAIAMVVGGESLRNGAYRDLEVSIDGLSYTWRYKGTAPFQRQDVRFLMLMAEPALADGCQSLRPGDQLNVEGLLASTRATVEGSIFLWPNTSIGQEGRQVLLRRLEIPVRNATGWARARAAVGWALLLLLGLLLGREAWYGLRPA